MSYPALEKGPYIFNVNNLYSESSVTNKAKRILLELKNCLVALGGANQIWTVIASSNSVAFVNIGGDEPLDLWDDISDIVFAAGGSPHSWCVLENKFTGQQIIIAANPSSYNCEVYVSPGGLIASDGSTTANPTCADYGGLWYAGYAFTTSNSNYLKFVINVMTSADYTITRFYLHERNVSTGEAGGMIGLMENAQNTPAEWNSDIKFVKLGYGSAPAYSNLMTGKSPTLTFCDGNTLTVRYQTAEPYDAWINAYPSCECYLSLLSAQAYPLMKNDHVLSLLGVQSANPIGIFNPANPKGGSLGRLADIYLAPALHDTFDTYPADGSNLWVKWGCFMVPWNGTIPVDAV